MDNVVNKIFTLEDKKKYLVFKQAYYKNRNYLISVEIKDLKIIPQLYLFEKIIKNNKEYIKLEQDEKIKKIIYKYLGIVN